MDPGEKVLFSCKVLKHNRWGMRQYRGMLVTNTRIYNLKDVSIQRKIQISSVKAITKSTKAGYLEFVVHVNDEYDYMFESDNRAEIFDAIKYIVWKSTGRNCPVYGVNDSLK